MTAVEWLVTEIAMKNNDINFDFWAAVEQAKEMEKQQIIAFLKWVGDGYDFQNNAKEIVNEYYNETFKIK
jgi:hypothetical protein